MTSAHVSRRVAPNVEPALRAPVAEIMAEIEKGQQLAGHFPSAEALERGRRVLVGEITAEDAIQELRAKYGV
ncbi:antitoxin VbhA family protein [Microbacteriaceae bacterium VKM Ac-2854]|nr:antitoxin VbhA family protein [Microbacteriaceae bacterium VKM Ac-2854]